MRNPFEAAGSWFRCALHAHTTNSDGELSPESLVHHYELAGFDVLAITDHWLRTEPSSTDGLLVLAGVELDAQLEGIQEAHLLAVGVDSAPERPLEKFPSVEETVEWVGGHGGLAFLAHPYWSGLRADQLASFDGLVGLEIFNAASELETGRGVATVHWDDLLAEGRQWVGIAVDDSHQPRVDSALGWTWVRARERSAAAVLEGLRDGCCYSSTGPKLERVDVDGNVVEVRCSPARRVTLMTGRTRGASVTAGLLGYRHRGEVLEMNAAGEVTAARLTAPAAAPYARLEVKDAHGATAWTNPLWMRGTG